MDPFSVSVAALIATKAAEGFGDHLGNDTASALERVFAAVRRRFRGDVHAEQTLQRVNEKPDDRTRVGELATALERYLRADDAFRTEMKELVAPVGGDQALTRFVIQITGDAEVGQVVNIGDVHGNISF